MDRSRIEKLLRMALQSVSPNEAAVARRMLESAGEWPPRSMPAQDGLGMSPLWAVATEEEDLRRWRFARAEFMAGRFETFYAEMYRSFMEGFSDGQVEAFHGVEYRAANPHRRA